MSNAPFNDTITLYTPLEGGTFKRQIITTVFYSESEDTSGVHATVYVPLYGRRRLVFRRHEEWRADERDSYSLFVGQRIVRGVVSDVTPPESALTIESTHLRLNGSRRMRHVKLIAKQIPIFKEEAYE